MYTAVHISGLFLKYMYFLPLLRSSCCAPPVRKLHSLSSFRLNTYPAFSKRWKVPYRNHRTSVRGDFSVVPFQTCPPDTKKASHLRNLLFTETGDVLLSQAASRQVSSALESLTSVFEMGTGVSSPLLSPDSFTRPLSASLCCASCSSVLTYLCTLRSSTLARLALQPKSFVNHIFSFEGYPQI